MSCSCRMKKDDDLMCDRAGWHFPLRYPVNAGQLVSVRFSSENNGGLDGY